MYDGCVVSADGAYAEAKKVVGQTWVQAYVDMEIDTHLHRLQMYMCIETEMYMYKYKCICVQKKTSLRDA